MKIVLLSLMVLVSQFAFASDPPTCHGGPGNYPYPCPAVPGSCHGGPGNYPYPCPTYPGSDRSFRTLLRD